MTERKKRFRSLSIRLLMILTAAMLLALVVNILSILDYVDDEAEEVLDARLLLTAKNLLRQSERFVREGNLNEAWLTLETIRGLENTWLKEFAMMEGGLFGTEVDSPGNEEIRAYVWFASADGLVKIGQPMPGYGAGKGAGLQTLRYDSHEWRVAAVQNKTAEHFLYVAQRDDLRTYLVHEIGGKLLQKELLSIPVIVLVLWLGIRRGLRPLSRLNAQIARRKPGNLQPVSVENIPGEIAPLVESINRLLKRLQSSLESERSFTANAAHELRNPLAVVRNVARILTRTDSMEEVHVSGRILDKSAERMGELLSQLLHLARLDALTQADLQEPVVLRTLLEDVVAELVPEADAQGIQLAYSCSEEAVLQADRELMSLLVHNLLGNAIKYGHQHAEISVSRDDGALRLEVLDDGPGVSDSELPHLFERFYRGTVAKQQAQGNGLGLSIVKRIVELHGFRISAGRRTEGGLRVSLLIPEGSWAPA
ncbi:MAG TPA: HAMP domain-containing protein [Thiolapillus brandeum]|uniref:histidine kinase n=4 Tax=Thiolapillus TaxID=1608298 RepID=A0A831W7X7_9GAMM|nr:HAMP domain-containing protein [Thiolapillus brandeum]